MATASTATKSLANGASRQVKAISRRASAQGNDLQKRIVSEGRALGQRASEFAMTAAQVTRNNPWAAAGIFAAAGALVGGLLWARRR